MYYINTDQFFEYAVGPQQENTWRARLACVKDFLIKSAIFPLALLGKASQTFFRCVGFCFAALCMFATLGGSQSARNLFVHRAERLAKDLADWIVLPLVLMFSFFKLILAIAIHPSFY